MRMAPATDLHIVQSNHSRGFISTCRSNWPLNPRSKSVREDGRMTDSGVPTTDIHAIPASIPRDLVVLDVREQHEWNAGHIAGAIHIPLGDLQARVGELDPAAHTLVVCHVGGRSARATQWLHAQGHDVVNLAGGMEVWESVGRPVVRQDPGGRQPSGSRPG